MGTVISRSPSVRCGGCGCEYGVDAWRALAKIHTMRGDDVHRYVVAWPVGRVVEVRACRTCGRPLARLTA